MQRVARVRQRQPIRVLFVRLSVTLSTTSPKFHSRYIVPRLSERNRIWHIDRASLAVSHFQDWQTLAHRLCLNFVQFPSLRGKKIESGYLHTFLVQSLPERDEISRFRRAGLAAHHFIEWWTLAHGDPCDTKNHKRLKKIVNTFVVRRFSKRDEIWRYTTGIGP